ncbi:MAG: hypothetical protein ACI976_001971 [Aureispira sp.]|jgi:hypothetical protein
MKKKSILDFFNYDLSKLDKEEFIHFETSYNKVGTKIEMYHKFLPNQELGIFNEIEFILFPSGEKNIFFYGNLDTLDKVSLQRFIIELIFIYGKDSSKCGKLTPQEWIKISRGSFWLGRDWDNISINSNHLRENCFYLSILGIKENQ